MNKKKMTLGIILIIAGVVVAALGFLPANSERQSTADSWNRLSSGEGIEAEGVIVASQSDAVTEGTRRNRQINTVYCAVYEYTAGGAKHTVQAIGDDCKDTKDEVVLGETAAIVYDEANPSEAFVKSDATAAFYKDTGGSQWVTWVFGALILFAGLITVATAKIKTPEQLAQQAEAKRKTDEELAKLMAEVDGTDKK